MPKNPKGRSRTTKSSFVFNNHSLIKASYMHHKESYDDYYTYDYELDINGPAFKKPSLSISSIEYL